MTSAWNRSYHRPRQARAGLHIWCIAIAENEGELENIHAAESSLEALRCFWSNAAQGASNHIPIADVLTVRTLKVGSTCLRAQIIALIEEAIAEDDIQRQDTLVFYWLGHAVTIDDNNHILFLPHVEMPGDERTRQVFFLQNLAAYIGWRCPATDQHLFFDCCSSPSGIPQDELPDRWPKSPQKKNGTHDRRQRIIVGSARGESGVSSDEADKAKPSLFAAALPRALDRFAADTHGHVGDRRRLLHSLGSLIAEEWVYRGYANFPRDLHMHRPVFPRFVHEILPRERKHHAHDEPMPLGTSKSPAVHILIGCYRFPGAKLLLKSNINLTPRPEAHLSRHTWHGEGSHMARYRAIIADESSREVLHCVPISGEPVVVAGVPGRGVGGGAAAFVGGRP